MSGTGSRVSPTLWVCAAAGGPFVYQGTKPGQNPLGLEKAHFDPYVPEIENYQLSGVVCNEYHGQQLAHLLYTDSKGQLIYILQVPVSVIQKRDMDLPEDVQKEIVKAKYYMCDEVDDNDCTMTLWYKENNVCASMTTMPKKEMVAAFTRFNK